MLFIIVVVVVVVFVVVYDYILNMHLQEADFDSIPIIDLSRLKSPHLHERQELARKIDEACTQVGFFYIKVC